MNPTIVKATDGTLKKFYGRKQKHLAKKYIEENGGILLTAVKPDNIIMPDGKILDSDGKPTGMYEFEF